MLRWPLAEISIYPNVLLTGGMLIFSQMGDSKRVLNDIGVQKEINVYNIRYGV